MCMTNDGNNADTWSLLSAAKLAIKAAQDASHGKVAIKLSDMACELNELLDDVSFEQNIKDGKFST